MPDCVIPAISPALSPRRAKRCRFANTGFRQSVGCALRKAIIFLTKTNISLCVSRRLQSSNWSRCPGYKRCYFRLAFAETHPPLGTSASLLKERADNRSSSPVESAALKLLLARPSRLPSRSSNSGYCCCRRGCPRHSPSSVSGCTKPSHTA